MPPLLRWAVLAGEALLAVADGDFDPARADDAAMADFGVGICDDTAPAGLPGCRMWDSQPGSGGGSIAVASTLRTVIGKPIGPSARGVRWWC